MPPWGGVDETGLPIGSAQRPVAVVLGPKGECRDLRLRGPGLDEGGWFMCLATRGVRGLTTDDDPTYRDRILLPIRRCLARERPPEAGPSTSCACWPAAWPEADARSPLVRRIGPGRSGTNINEIETVP